MLSLIESYFSVLMLFGAAQAVTGIVLLFINKQKPFSNNMLALLLFAWGFSCYWFFAYIQKDPFFSVALTTFIGPMLSLTLFPPVFLYVKYLFYDYTSFQKIDHLHFLPIYIYLGFTLYLYFDSDFSVLSMRQHPWYHARAMVASYVATLQGPFYFIKTRHILKLRQKMLEEEYSEIESRKLEWFQIINNSFALVFIIGGISTLVNIAYVNPYALYMAYHAVIAISLFYITLMIYKYPAVFKEAEERKIPFTPATVSTTNPQINQPTTEPLLDALSPSNEIDKESRIITKLENSMREHKYFKNPDFKLNDLAEAISESRNAISHALNNTLHKTFYTYINELRIAESKRLLSDKKLMHLTIDGIAAESGFKTMSVFYKFFKQNEKVTPAVYRKSKMKPLSTDN